MSSKNEGFIYQYFDNSQHFDTDRSQIESFTILQPFQLKFYAIIIIKKNLFHLKVFLCDFLIDPILLCPFLSWSDGITKLLTPETLAAFTKFIPQHLLFGLQPCEFVWIMEEDPALFMIINFSLMLFFSQSIDLR